MNIKQAKDQIRQAIVAYLCKNEFGDYRIPLEKQRPVFLLGAPGIGKTAIMEQIAQELGIALVSYSMTHHTRQSALGLPFIVRKTYAGQDYDVSEYTMSEIIASVYDTIEATGLREGILFLDEINCVSETLAPAMLQFLQFKIFGRHRIPRGWIVVTAGNPPEYNKSVREFDIVTMDRLKRMDVEPDYPAWKEYAYKKNIHGAILAYLEIRKADFYAVETTVEGKRFVTARGWEDLSQMIGLFETLGLVVDQDLVGQYLQHRRIAREFAIYYELYNKYRTDYQIGQILAGAAGPEVRERARAARFDERLSLLGLLLDTVHADMRTVIETEAMVQELLAVLRQLKPELQQPEADCPAILQRQVRDLHRTIEVGEKGATLAPERKLRLQQVIRHLEDSCDDLLPSPGHLSADGFTRIKGRYDQAVTQLQVLAEQTGRQLANLFAFTETVFDEGHEMLVLVTELTISSFAARFISRFGCAAYFAHHQDLMLYERQQDLIAELEPERHDG